MNYSKLNKEALLDLAMEREIEVPEGATNDTIAKLLKEHDQTGAVNTSTTPDDNEEEVPPVVTPPTTIPKPAKKQKEQVVAGIYADDKELMEILKKENTVSVYIPKEVGEPEGSAQIVMLNGVQFNITKGVIVECPQSIAEIVNYAIIKERNEEVQHLLQ